MKKQKNCGGFTLIELIIVMLMMGILMIAILNMVLPVNAVYRDTNEYQYQRAISENINKLLQESVRYSDDMIIIQNCGSTPEANGTIDFTDYKMIKIDNEEHLYKKKLVKGRVYTYNSITDTVAKMSMDDEYCDVYTLEITFSRFTGSQIKTEIVIYRKDSAAADEEKKFTTGGTIVCPNFKLSTVSGAITEIDAATALSPQNGLTFTSGDDTYIIYREATAPTT